MSTHSGERAQWDLVQGLRDIHAYRYGRDSVDEVSIYNDAANEIERLRALTEGDPTSIYHEAARMREALEAIRLVTFQVLDPNQKVKPEPDSFTSPAPNEREASNGR